MSLQNKIQYILIITLLCFLFISINRCSDNENKANNTLKELHSKTNYYKNEIGTLTASKEVLTLSNKDLKKHILKQNDTIKTLSKKFNKIKSLVSYDAIVKIDSFEVIIKDTIPCNFKVFDRYDTKHLSFNYQFTDKSIKFEDFTIPNETFLITGTKRKWFLGKKHLYTEITNSNPLIRSLNVKSYEIMIHKPFYDTRLFNIGVGLGIGLLLK